MNNTETYYAAVVPVAFDEDGKGKVEVVASVGEFDGVTLHVFGRDFELVELMTRDDVDAMIEHLIAARDIAFAGEPA